MLRSAKQFALVFFLLPTKPRRYFAGCETLGAIAIDIPLVGETLVVSQESVRAGVLRLLLPADRLRIAGVFRLGVSHLKLQRNRHASPGDPTMNNNSEHLTHARALRADILAAPDVWLPRREVLLDWLDKFLQRVAGPSYELADTEADDLGALDKFLRKRHVPIAGK